MSRRDLLSAAPIPLAIAAMSSAALLAAEHPANARPDERRATAADYAALSFDALEVNFDDVRAAYENQWTSLAVGMLLMTKSPNECRDLVANMKEDEETFGYTLDLLEEGADWFRLTAEILSSAHIRFLSGAARCLQLEDDQAPMA